MGVVLVVRSSGWMRRPHTSQTHHRVVSTGRCDISRSLVGVIVPTLRRIPAIRTDMMSTNEYVGIPEITKKKNTHCIHDKSQI